MIINTKEGFLNAKYGLHIVMCVSLFLTTTTMVLSAKDPYSLMEKGIISYAFVLCGIYTGRACVKRWLSHPLAVNVVTFSCTLIVISTVFAGYWNFFINNDRNVHIELLSISIPMTMLSMLIGSFLTLANDFILRRKDNAVTVRDVKVNPQQESSPTPEYLFIKSSGKVYKVAFKDLLYAEASGNCTKVITGGGSLTYNMSFSNFEQLLPPEHFIRTHRSFIINKSKISHIEGNRVFLGQFEIPKWRNFKQNFSTLIGL